MRPSCDGSIPAWAGEPLGGEGAGRAAQVHPRVGGGAWCSDVGDDFIAGPSPRGRGSHDLDLVAHPVVRSIPAWAGEPRSRRTRRTATEVHPRVGGGAELRRRRAARRDGPSPRGRGSRAQALDGPRHERSIPAWAGEPYRARPARCGTEVHPRVGGGAAGETLVLLAPGGPSPRGRGSRCRAAERAGHKGSIPAWAGEPLSPEDLFRHITVHPRVGGGAVATGALAFAGMGPSPRGRGSHSRRRTSSATSRSIPAWAGEPPRP